MINGDMVEGFELTSEGRKPYSMPLETMIEKIKANAEEYDKSQQEREKHHK